MRTWLRILVGLPLIAVPATAGDTPEADDGLDVFFRDSDLAALAEQEWARYPDQDPGDGELLPRAFEGAPPQIPHSIEDMLPILPDDNICVECHSPEEAGDMGATPIPESHFRRPRIVGGGGTPDTGEGPMLVRVAGYETSSELSGFQFHCVQCHVPQAENVKDVASTFQEGAR